MKMLDVIATSILMTASLTGAAYAQEAPKSLRIGTSLTQMPWGFYDDNQKPTGVDVALCGAIAKQLGSNAEFISLDFKGLIPALQADRFDMVCAAMYITPEREQAIAMVPYIQASQTVVTKKTGTGGALRPFGQRAAGIGLAEGAAGSQLEMRSSRQARRYDPGFRHPARRHPCA